VDPLELTQGAGYSAKTLHSNNSRTAKVA